MRRFPACGDLTALRLPPRSPTPASEVWNLLYFPFLRGSRTLQLISAVLYILYIHIDVRVIHREGRRATDGPPGMNSRM